MPARAQLPYNMQPAFLNANKVWAFGNKAGLDFNTGVPVPFESAHSGIEGGAAAADPVTGRFLFYSNGHTCWNAGNQPMPNGRNLMGNGTGSCSSPCLSTRQGVCIVPVIGAPKQYYLFSLMGITNDPPTYANGSLFYSVVDMRLDNGKGDIIPGSKNRVLSSDSLSECMIAIPGNNCDIWLLTHEMENHRFRAWHITAAGVDPNPVISTVVSSIAGRESFTMSELSVSPDRRRIALTSQTLDNSVPKTARGILLAEFDPNTGIVSNGFNLMHTGKYENFYPGSASFSPGGSILYASAYSNLTNWKYVIYQYDITSHDSATIAGSVMQLDTLTNGTPVIFKLYNNKIYLTELNQSSSPLHCINRPDVRGKGYSLDIGIAYFLPGTYATLTLGNHVVQAPAVEGISEITREAFLCAGQNLTLTPSRILPGGRYTWDDNSATPSRTVSRPGIYQVTYTETGCDVTKETFTVREIKLDPRITPHEYTLHTIASYTGYQWMLNGSSIPGATDSAYEVKENGNYQVVVYDDNGCADTSEIYIVNNVSVTAIPAGSGISIYPNPAKDMLYVKTAARVHITLSTTDGRCLVRSSGTAPLPVAHLAEGIYFLRVTDETGKLLKVQKIIKQ